jgi:hypothetical protein
VSHNVDVVDRGASSALMRVWCLAPPSTSLLLPPLFSFLLPLGVGTCWKSHQWWRGSGGRARALIQVLIGRALPWRLANDDGLCMDTCRADRAFWLGLRGSGVGGTRIGTSNLNSVLSKGCHGCVIERGAMAVMSSRAWSLRERALDCRCGGDLGARGW